MPAQVGRDDAKPARQTLLGQLAKARPVTSDPVQADDEGGARVAPFMDVQARQLSPSGS